jgi:hypothetical protein
LHEEYMSMSEHDEAEGPKVSGATLQTVDERAIALLEATRAYLKRDPFISPELLAEVEDVADQVKAKLRPN